MNGSRVPVRVMAEVLTRFRWLCLSALTAFGVASATYAGAQFALPGDFSGPQQEPPQYFYYSSLSRVALSAVAGHDFALAAKLISLLDEPAYEERLVVPIAIAQARAGDLAGSDRTTSLLKDPHAVISAYIGTGAVLAEHGRAFEARGRFAKAFHLAVTDSESWVKRYYLESLLRQEIHADYRTMARVTIDRFEMEVRETALSNNLAKMQMSRWYADIGEIDAALRWYRLIPATMWEEYGKSGRFCGPDPYLYRSPIPSIAAAYVRSGNTEAAWRLYASLTNRRERVETLRDMAEAALQQPPARAAQTLVAQVLVAADAVPWADRMWMMSDLTSDFEKARSPLSARFADVQRYHLTAADEVAFRLTVASRISGIDRRKALGWIAPVPRLLSQMTEADRRASATANYAAALWAMGKKTEGRALLDKSIETCSSITEPDKRIRVLYGINWIVRNWKDTTRQKRTDIPLLKLMRAYPGSWPEYMVTQLIRAFLQRNERDNAAFALELFKQYADRHAAEKNQRNAFHDQISQFEGEIAGTRQPAPDYNRVVVLSEVLLNPDEARRAEELDRYISQLLQAKQDRRAVQILPLFPIKDEVRARLKVVLHLK